MKTWLCYSGCITTTNSVIKALLSISTCLCLWLSLSVYVQYVFLSRLIPCPSFGMQFQNTSLWLSSASLSSSKTSPSSLCLSQCLSVPLCPLVCTVFGLSACLSVCPSIRLSVCSCVCLSVRLPVRCSFLWSVDGLCLLVLWSVSQIYSDVVPCPLTAVDIFCGRLQCCVIWATVPFSRFQSRLYSNWITLAIAYIPT